MSTAPLLYNSATRNTQPYEHTKMRLSTRGSAGTRPRWNVEELKRRREARNGQPECECSGCAHYERIWADQDFCP